MADWDGHDNRGCEQRGGGAAAAAAVRVQLRLQGELLGCLRLGLGVGRSLAAARMQCRSVPPGAKAGRMRARGLVGTVVKGRHAVEHSNQITQCEMRRG